MVKERVFVSTWSDAIMNDMLFCPTNHVTAIMRRIICAHICSTLKLCCFQSLLGGGAPKLTLVLCFSPSLPCPLPKTRTFASQGGAPGTRSVPCYQDNPKQTPPFITCQEGCRRRFMSCRVLGDSVHALENTE